MTAQPANQHPLDHEAPLNSFSQCHAGILSQLQMMAELPVLAAAAAKARVVATGTLAMFQDEILEHHAQEESELFPAVLRSARPGEERDRVEALVQRLLCEHRTLEALWTRIEHAVSSNAKGRPVEVDAAAVAELVCAYGAHARLEEEEFLPLAETILGRNGNHMAALGLSLHLRHATQPAGYI
jgi:hemerythrin-like domain-containing protein